MSRYKQVYDGQSYTIVGRNNRFRFSAMCCNCGLVHREELRVSSARKIEALAWQDRRATRLARKRSKMRVLDLSYVAGFFDGEGSITVTPVKRSPRGLSPNHTLQVSIGNTDPRALEWIHNNFGGSLTVRYPNKKNHRNVLQWIIRAAMALPFLRAIEPFVKMKREQVRLGIQFQEPKHRHGSKRVTITELKRRELIRRKIQKLNGEARIPNRSTSI